MGFETSRKSYIRLISKSHSHVSDYVMVWCRKNGMTQPTESLLNDAITERISYAHKQLKPKVKKNVKSK